MHHIRYLVATSHSSQSLKLRARNEEQRYQKSSNAHPHELGPFQPSRPISPIGLAGPLPCRKCAPLTIEETDIIGGGSKNRLQFPTSAMKAQRCLLENMNCVESTLAVAMISNECGERAVFLHAYLLLLRLT